MLDEIHLEPNFWWESIMLIYENSYILLHFEESKNKLKCKKTKGISLPLDINYETVSRDGQKSILLTVEN